MMLLISIDVVWLSMFDALSMGSSFVGHTSSHQQASKLHDRAPCAVIARNTHLHMLLN